MTDVVSIRFKPCGKIYYFDPNGTQPKEGDRVVVETANGRELAYCAQGVHGVADDRVVLPLQPVLRVATEGDLRVVENHKKKEAEAFEIGKKKIAEHGLDMKLVNVECNFDGNKITFFFTSDGRVDFRELVKDLASVFRSRIELRQIGVRDEAKMMGGLGICGRPFCCSQFLNEFYPVSTKMAKVQNMSLNPKKISGCCGRLMCCLRYEQEAYEDLVKTVPKNGAFVQTPDGYGNVTQVNLLRQQVKVRLDGENPTEQHNYSAEQVAAVPGGRPKEGEPLPDVLKYVPKVEPEVVEERDEWEDIILLDEYEDQDKKQERKARMAAAEKAEQEARENYENQRRNRNNNNRRRPNGKREGGRSGGQNQPKQAQGERAEKPAERREKPQQSPDKKRQGGQQDQNRRNRQPRQNQGGQKPAEEKAAKPNAGPQSQNGEKKPNHNNNRRRHYNNRKPKSDKPTE